MRSSCVFAAAARGGQALECGVQTARRADPEPDMIPAPPPAPQPAAPAAVAADWRLAWREAVRDPAELLRMLELPGLAARVSASATAQFPLRVPRGFVARMRK